MLVKSGLRAASFFAFVLFALLCRDTIAQQQALLSDGAPARPMEVEIQRAAQNPVWHALLHLQDGQPQIRDRDFLLTLNNFSAENELRATLTALTGPDSATAACRFPARASWLNEQGLTGLVSTAHCVDWQEFSRRAPASSITLVFASEILSQPSSMMGHLFLKIEGLNSDNQKLAHAIAFYTDSDTWNLAKLFYESTIMGKDGYFVLSPYQDEVYRYAVKEQRSLWTYQLKLDDLQRRRVLAHMHELRQTKITYFFQSYNCATLVQHILAVAWPEMLSNASNWTTPKGVLRKASKIGMLGDAAVQAPSRWQIRSLSSALSSDQVTAIARSVETQDASRLVSGDAHGTSQEFLSLQLAQALYRYQRPATSVDLSGYLQDLSALQASRHPNLQLTLNNSRDPSRSAPERQLSIGWMQRDNKQFALLRFLPASHALSDDNSPYFGENELRLFDTTLAVDLRSGQPRLERLTVYSVQSLLPNDDITGGLSGRFHVTVEPMPNTRTPSRNALQVGGAVGRTWRFQSDIDFYALVGGGWGWRNSGFIYAQPEVGVIIREAWRMKTLVSRSVISNPLGEKRPTQRWNLTQSYQQSQNHSWVLSWGRTRQHNKQIHETHLNYKYLF
jgi:hypothetical protein